MWTYRRDRQQDVSLLVVWRSASVSNDTKQLRRRIKSFSVGDVAPQVDLRLQARCSLCD